MSFSGYNTSPTNFAFEANKYADPYAKIGGVGCAGTNQGYLASKSVFVEPPYIIGGKKRMRSKHKRSKHKRSKHKRSKHKRSKHKRSKKYVGGNSGYGFTGVPIAPVAGPGAPYSEVKGYNTLGNYRDLFPPLFKGTSLTGGKKYKQYGRNNKSHKHKKRGSSKHYTKRSRRGGNKWSARRQWMMRGGMSSTSDYTTGRDSSQDQPYGNKAISFGQGLNSMLDSGDSALASPPPLLPYNNCGKVMRA